MWRSLKEPARKLSNQAASATHAPPSVLFRPTRITSRQPLARSACEVKNTINSKVQGESVSAGGLGELAVAIYRRTWWTLPIAAMFGIFAAFYAGLIPLHGANLSEHGQFGDSFGVLNSLYTGLGFGGLVVTLVLQQKQISQQEKQIEAQQKSEATRHFEASLYHLLEMYQITLDEVSNPKGSICKRDLLKASTKRAHKAMKDEGVHSIPHPIQDRYRAKALQPSDQMQLDYLYFRNFKILTVEIDRQSRLTETLKSLLSHLVDRLPEHLDADPYRALVSAQITHIEVSYFYLVALAFEDENNLRRLLFESGLFARAALTRRWRVHDYMYREFWGYDVRDFRRSSGIPMNDKRVAAAINAHAANNGGNRLKDPWTYTSPRIAQAKPKNSNR